jgi:hypothetical protein
LTDLQILTIALAIILPLAALIWSNSRPDAPERNLKAHIDNAFEHMKMLLELHEVKHHKD